MKFLQIHREIEIMADLRKILSRKFELKNQYNNFGNILNKIDIDGFRGIRNLTIEINFPITAITGLNGAGKSTIGQLAMCGYKLPDGREGKRSYVKDFFPVSPADPAPFESEAKVVYTYANNSGKSQQATISRSDKSQWSGYKRQPKRSTYYVGFTEYIPKVERRDLSIYGGKNLNLTNKRSLAPDVISKMAKIIGHSYDSIDFQEIEHKSRTSELGIAKRLGYSYSENNMGFGEGRILYTVDLLENAPNNSLFILEEPETSLHENAQHEFSKYLLDVCNRKGHQIILSTHSSVIINALPSETRKLLIRDKDGVHVYNNISSMQINSILSNGYKRDLNICVEDDFAKKLIQEAIRRINPQLITMINIESIGGENEIKSAMKIISKLNKNVIAVLDADMAENLEHRIMKLPGELPPEKEVFSKPEVMKFIIKKYSITEIKLLIDNTEDHHQYSKEVSRKANCNKESLESLVIEEYLNFYLNNYKDLINKIEEHIN